jgi:PHD/YefM family antitoxin component YafN of YafNO toxin-antitoxin module
MKTYTITELKKNTAEVLDQMGKDSFTLIIQNGKPKTIMLDVEDQDLERWLMEIRYMRARWAVDAMRVRSQELGNDRLTMEEIDEIIARVRKAEAC